MNSGEPKLIKLYGEYIFFIFRPERDIATGVKAWVISITLQRVTGLMSCQSRNFSQRKYS